VYEVTEPIGEGGMGQVWRATDTTLGRQVAIKILPDAFASDPERLARFEREAKTLASLNHPTSPRFTDSKNPAARTRW
jgi:serine/threonine protein kinase